MNLYVVVEGLTEMLVYPHWIESINSSLSRVHSLSDVSNDNYILLGDGGYPYIYRLIDSAIEDIRLHGSFDRLVVVLDSDDDDLTTRFNDVDTYIRAKAPIVPYVIVVQHFCIEAWALGNKKFLNKKPKDQPLKSYKAKFDVCVNDPEHLPDCPENEWNRSQFAEQYLKVAVRNRASHLTYSKSKPHLIAHPTYLAELLRRTADDGHLKSIQTLVTAFR